MKSNPCSHCYHEPERQTQKVGLPIIDILLKPSDEFAEGVNPALLEEQRRRKKKQRHRHL